jgi:hypothetical protein
MCERGGGGFGAATPRNRLLPALCPDAINVFRLQAEPFQEGLVPRRMARLEHSMPSLHLRVLQADLPEHAHPLVYVHLVIHMSIYVVLAFIVH